MKKVIQGNELKEKMKEAINLLCDTVSSTLGPTGNNVLINQSEYMPFITNDGVTIAENISSDDVVVDTILSIAKEASLKTNEVVGDGTTTTLVLLKQLFLEGLKCILNGKNAILLSEELKECVSLLKKEILKLSKVPNQEEIRNVAIISSNDEEIGTLVWEVYKKVKRKGAIRILESPTNNTFYEITKGYSLETNTLPDYYFENKQNVLLRNSYTLLIEGELDSFEQIGNIVNEILVRKVNLVIIGENLSEEVKQEIYVFNKSQSNKIYFIEIPDYASEKHEILKDLECVTNSKTVNILMDIPRFHDLGVSLSIDISKNSTIISSSHDNPLLKERISYIQNNLKSIHDEYQKEILEERLAKLKKGIAFIFVGGVTKSEKKERIMRFQDCVCTIESSKKGIVPGEGLVFLQAKEKLSYQCDGLEIIKKACDEPFNKIMENNGLSAMQIKSKILKNNFEVIYNIFDKSYEKVGDSKIVDSTLVVVSALENAVSIANLLLTTNYLVINEVVSHNQEQL